MNRFLFLLLAAICTSTFSGFGAGRQLTGAYAPAPHPALPPVEAQKQFVVPDGFEARLFAAEPDVINPVAMTWDERGRLWVVELYEYPLGAASGTKPRDRIKILEDSDNDGRADKVTVFADGLNLATGLLLGNGGVYVGQAPDILFLSDTNGDDIADTRITLLTGFGLEDRHELLNGFTWGPDGWMYLTHGVFTHSKVKIPEASAPGVEVTAAVARFDPRTKKFEVFADGTSNPWGVDFDRDGNAFVSACVIDHLFHMAPGGIYVRQGGTPPNPYAYELLPSIVQHKHHMAAYCGICIYQGDQFPKTYRGHVFMGNIHQNALNHDTLTPKGASFVANAETDFLATKDEWFRPVSEQVGPDGALWVADWYDKYPCYQNAQADPEGVDRERGRIWRVVFAGDKKNVKIGSRPDRDLNLGKLSNPDLVKLLAHPNIWQRRMAQRILSERIAPTRGQGNNSSLKQQLTQLSQHGASSEARLAAFWTLQSSGLFTNANEPLELLTIKAEPALRSWAIRFAAENLLANGRNDAAQLLESLREAASDPEPSVRLATAVAIRQLVAGALTVDSDVRTDIPAGKALAALIEHSAKPEDPLLPFLIWMASEPLVAAHPEAGLKWLAQHGSETLPLSATLTRKGMLRLCDTQDRGKLALTARFLESIATNNSTLAIAALDGLITGQRAKPMPPSGNTESLFQILAASENTEVRERGKKLGTLWGNAGAIQATLADINDPTKSVDDRIKAIHVAGELKNAAAREALTKVLTTTNPPTLTTEAIRGLGQIGDDSIPNELLQHWKRLAPEPRAAAADVLASRRRWAIALLAAVESKAINPNEIPLSAIRTLGDSKDDFVRQRAAQAIGRIRPANADKQKLIEEKKKMILTDGPADLKAGHELARKTCFVCHKLLGEGSDVGPDLTGVGRSSLDALLSNVIDPNQVVGHGYENVLVETKDGRSLSGRLVEDTPTHIKLLSAGPKEEVIAKSDIETRRVSELSVMPEGLEQMPDNDFRNLILYVLHPEDEKAK